MIEVTNICFSILEFLKYIWFSKQKKNLFFLKQLHKTELFSKEYPFSNYLHQIKQFGVEKKNTFFI